MPENEMLDDGLPKRLTIDTLGDLDDGLTRKLVDKTLTEALADCEARPGLNKPRRVTLVIEFLPVLGQFGGLKGVEAGVAVGSKLPARAGRAEYLRTSFRGDTVEAFLPEDQPQPLFPEKPVEGN